MSNVPTPPVPQPPAPPAPQQPMHQQPAASPQPPAPQPMTQAAVDFPNGPPPTQQPVAGFAPYPADAPPQQQLAVQPQQVAVPAVTAAAANVPAYLQNEDETGLEAAAQYIVPPRLKIVQALSQPPISDLFNAGDVIAQPQNLLVAPMPYENNRATDRGEPFTFVPLFFFVEWCTWNPRGSKQAIAERTLDDSHPIAAKARDPRLREETLSDGRTVRHCEHFCFVVMLDAGPLAGVPVMMTFLRGEHRTGSTFLGLARMRRAPLYAQRFTASAGLRRNDDGEWYGFDIANPAENAWVAEEQLADYKRRYQELREAHSRNLLRVDYEDENTGNGGQDIDGQVRSSASEF